MRQIPLGEDFGGETFGLVEMSAPGPGMDPEAKTHAAWFAIALDRTWYLRPVGPPGVSLFGDGADPMPDDEARRRLFAHHMWERRVAAWRAEKERSR